MEFENEVGKLIALAHARKLRILMVGGAAVNFHGYRRHSADIDFWIELNQANLDKLEAVLKELGYAQERLPQAVRQGQQNVSVKISPEQEIELSMNFDPGKTFAEAWEVSEKVYLIDDPNIHYRVLSYGDLVDSKLRAARPKDLLDIQELRRIRQEEN